jgi:hypothetical protein
LAQRDLVSLRHPVDELRDGIVEPELALTASCRTLATVNVFVTLPIRL